MKIISVSQFIEYINEALRPFCSAKVEGEVTDFSISRNKWVSFDLKDEENEQILPCFTAYSLFKSKGMADVLEEGMRVQVRGQVKIRDRGNFSMFMKEIQLAGEGTLKKAYKKLKKKLKKEGLFSEERKRSIPDYPQKIGIITSGEARAYGDFLKVLEERMGGIKVYHAETHVQGENAVPEILGAFRYLNKEMKDLDLVVLTRGGGSLDDLQAFNSEQVARAVFSSEVPVVCGVGHEDDITLAGLTADLRASTPSNAAELIVRSKSEVISDIENMIAKVERSMEDKINNKQEQINNFYVTGSSFVKNKEKQVDTSVLKLRHELSNFVSEIQSKQGDIKSIEQDLERSINKLLERLNKDIEHKQKLLKSYSPDKVLQRGYSIVRKEGQVVKNTDDIKQKDEVFVKLSDGEFKGEVKELIK